MFDQKGHIPIEQIEDPKTGETIHRVDIDPKLTAEIDKTIQRHQNTMNAFVMNSQAFFIGLQSQLDLVKDIKLADEAIKKTLGDIQKKAKLDPKKPWAWNLQLKTFEFRTPPIVKGMTSSEIENSQNPGQKPVIVNQPGVAVK